MAPPVAKLFAAGQAGERFAVRNSGAIAVVEGAGDHCCEYMTGGVVCVLGPTGVNFGAGFTGGFAYVLDLDRDFVDRYNHELIDIHRITPEGMQTSLQHLQHLIERHVAETGSVWGEEILRDFRSYIGKFWVVKPKAAAIDSLIENLQQGRMMSAADKNLQFLDIPRHDPEKLPVEVRKSELPRDLRRSSTRTALRSRRGAASPAAIPFCEWKCPVHNYIPNWLKLIQEGKLFEAAELSHQTNSLPEDVRPHLPAGSAVRRCLHAQRRPRCGDHRLDRKIHHRRGPEAGLAAGHVRVSLQTGKRVAVIGAGPAGLGCADILVRNGVEPVVFDAYAQIGGLLTFGIPPFKLEKDSRRDAPRDHGRHGRGIPTRASRSARTFRFEQLLEEFDAVFLGMGTYTYVKGGFPGEDLPGVLRGAALPDLEHQSSSLSLPGGRHSST